MPHASPSSHSKLESPIEYAERVLFSESLSEKLRLPRKLDFSEPLATDSSRNLYGIEPGRPEHLRFAQVGSTRPTLPAEPALVEESSRAVLLHFFANHELLAAELMALAVLRFRNAPIDFIEGLCQTLKEEQRHTFWYVNRMRQCGVEFGELPVNRFFWDGVSTMENPLDYVSRLSLTFEQANLDYSQHYAKVLSTAGDSDSARILDRIYRDEISHVGYGLKWFRKWKESSDTDWRALEKQLVFPLSPIRAKGNQIPFNEAGRREAGLDDDFIDHLKRYERSRGRTPNVYYFNPEVENRIAALPGPYHANKRIRSVINDLEILTLFLAKRDDLVLMRNQPSHVHHQTLSDAGFFLPEIEALDSEGKIKEDSLLNERKIHQFLPWAKAPNLDQTFSIFQETECSRANTWKWAESDRALYSKAHQATRFAEWFGPSFAIREREDLEHLINALPQLGYDEAILKPSLASAGGGMRRLTMGDLQSLLDRGFDEMPRDAAEILIEPLHDRVFDFSIQFEAQEGKVRRLAFIEQIIAPSGGYRGSISMPKFCQGLPTELARFLMTEALPVYEEESPLISTLEAWAGEHSYTGPIGVDAYLYRAPGTGQLQHRAICEINPRFTMGRVAHEMRKQVAGGHGIMLEITKTESLGSTTAPPGMIDRRLGSGSLVVTETHPDSAFSAILHVAKQRSNLPARSSVPT